MSPQRVMTTFSLLLPTVCLAGTVLRIDGDGEMRGRRVYLDSTFLGNAGTDGAAVPVTEFHHILSVERPDGLFDAYDLALKSGQIHLTPVSQTQCSGVTNWRTTPNGAPEVQGGPDEFFVTLSAVPSQFEGMCSFEVPYLRCDQKETLARIQSIPEVGAEVSIDGRALTNTTAMELRIPYCAGMSPPVSIVLKKTGYAPCSVRLDFGNGLDTYDVSCSLRRLNIARNEDGHDGKPQMPEAHADGNDN